ncbi:C4-dicarboxylate ABC transporter [Zobellella endophytica]|uniref:C4-dicarboxylate ABC transporter n=1 Tax=Zobellella endophytica TaxID=2116700 RepID=A0A2P7R629_9GAMM|nr:TRAP transporter substrate-binding protein [Zobellella endophytica]PSJ45653.1 C4-dicarboxylate ABC transporter [Zobellella endophytica]
MVTLKKLFAVTAIASALTFSFSASAERMRLGHVTPPSHIWNQVAERFNDNLKEASGGKHSIMIFPLSKLGGDDQMIDLLQSGGMQLAILTAGSLSNRAENMNAWFLPYIFEDVTDAAEASKHPAAQEMLENLKQHKLVGLGYTFAGMRHVISSKPMTSADDFKNKKIRSFPNKLFNDWWNQLGAAPTALAISDVSSALTTNLLDAVDVDLDIVVGLKMYQQAPYLTLTNHMAFPGVVVASEVWWNRLSEEDRTLVLNAFKEAEEWGFRKQAEAEISNLALLEKEGVTINEFDEAQLQEAAAAVVESYTAASAGIDAFYQQQRQQ